jgi:hypothetical protein
MKIFNELFREIERLIEIAPLFLIVVAFLVIRNWYNRYKKNTFRDEVVQLNELLQNVEIQNTNYTKQLESLRNLEQKFTEKKSEIFQLKKEVGNQKQETQNLKQQFHLTLDKKEEEIAQQKEKINHQKEAYKRYVNFKDVEANNTRLGAHFIKNVISQIYTDLEDLQTGYKTFFGIQFKLKKANRKILPIKALKNIFKLLDYNVSSLNKESTAIHNELEHINLFIELIQYLKPNAKIKLNNSLTKNQVHTLRIKPTLFFPFIENALKHGSLNEEDSFISIVLKENANKQLSYCLVNSAEQRLEQEHQIAQTSNFGLNALQQLLDAYYPNSKLEHKTLPNKQYLSELTLSLH